MEKKLKKWMDRFVRVRLIQCNSIDLNLFHFDYDSFNFLKVMVYVSDVCRECGPHCYIKHSHKEFPGSLRDVGINPYGRFTDAHMYGAYGPDSGIEVLGEAGTVILVDTSGFHKGKILSGNARRIMVQTEFIDTFTHFGK